MRHHKCSIWLHNIAITLECIQQPARPFAEIDHYASAAGQPLSLQLVRRMGMPGTVTALAWHPRINQIFVGAGVGCGVKGCSEGCGVARCGMWMWGHHGWVHGVGCEDMYRLSETSPPRMLGPHPYPLPVPPSWIITLAHRVPRMLAFMPFPLGA